MSPENDPADGKPARKPARRKAATPKPKPKPAAGDAPARKAAAPDAPSPEAAPAPAPEPAIPLLTGEEEERISAARDKPAAPALRPGVKMVNLALQGGGAHGAFTWGALDRLMEEERIEVEGISGASAGAMNAAAFKAGFVDGGREGAKAALATLWGEIGEMSRANFNPMLEWVKAVNPTVENIANAIEAGPRNVMGDTLTRMFSPYDVNPFDINPLRRLLDRKLDFDAVCADCGPKLFIGATNVRTGKIRVFHNDELCTDMLVASACLPSVFQAVEFVDPRTGREEAFWDGGYTGNPALFPLFYETHARDILIVHINPIRRDEVPRSAREIENRVNEISFNASLLFELRAIDFVRRLIEQGAIRPGTMKDVLVHSIADDGIMRKLGGATKVFPDRMLLQKLREAGSRAMDAMLTERWEDIGVRPTANLRRMFN